MSITEAQSAAVEAYQRLGSIRKAAQELGKAYSTTHQHILAWQTKMLKEGGVPLGYKLIGVSTTRDKNGDVKGTSEQVRRAPLTVDPIVIDAPITRMTTHAVGGEVQQQWYRQTVSDETKAKMWKEYAEALLKPVIPAWRGEWAGLDPLLKAKDQLAVYPIGDYHVGLLAWGAETRSDNHDLDAAEHLLQEAAETLMDAAPPCETAVLAFMGDFIHFDSFRPETPRSKNLMDTDSRFGKVGRTAMRVVRHVIAAARRRHRHVHIIWLRGNHDESVAELIKMFLGIFYEGEPGITVDTSPSYFSYYEFGNNLFGFAHGDKLKPEKMPMVMATDMGPAWGRCELRTIFTAHLHQKALTDEFGVIMEKVPVIIPGDAYSVNAGYRSRRRMEVVVYDREFGEMERKVYNPQRYYRGR